MFRTLGLRHLCVVNRRHQVLGIVTRADLVAAHSQHTSGEGEIPIARGERKKYFKAGDSIDECEDSSVDEDSSMFRDVFDNDSRSTSLSYSDDVYDNSSSGIELSVR